MKRKGTSHKLRKEKRFEPCGHTGFGQFCHLCKQIKSGELFEANNGKHYPGIKLLTKWAGTDYYHSPATRTDGTSAGPKSSRFWQEVVPIVELYAAILPKEKRNVFVKEFITKHTPKNKAKQRKK